MGAKVYATAGSDEKCKACEDLGATLAVNYKEHDFLPTLKDHNDGKGIDVILDMVGGEYIQKNLFLAAVEGRIINIAYLQGPVNKVNFLPVMLKRLSVTGSTLRPQSLDAKAAIAKQLREKVWPLLENKTIKPVIAKTFPLEEVVDAHTLMESNAHIGKIILDLS
jgi:NADPH:quinone reductase-like Zn-dependent oxidoreductase